MEIMEKHFESTMAPRLLETMKPGEIYFMSGNNEAKRKSMIVDLSISAAMDNKTVGIINPTISNPELVKSILCVMSDMEENSLDVNILKSVLENQKITKAIEMLEKLSVYIDDRVDTRENNIVERISELAKRKAQYILVDGFYMVNIKYQVGIINELKVLAAKNMISIVLFV